MKIKKLLPHASIVMSLVFLFFWVADKFNGSMNFIANNVSKWLLILFVISSIATSIAAIAEERRND